MAGLKYGPFANGRSQWRRGPNMNPIQNSPIAKRSPEKTVMEKLCRHTRVRVVAREEDVEFVECQECGEVFESSEFKDMAIEENIRPEEA
jgi:Zn ribbon nucleic-acid-binding protein